METYSFLRELADSWVLLAMFTFFLGAGVWAFWPSQRQARQDAADIPFRNDEAARADAGPDHGSRMMFHEEAHDV